jgi:hypothetical protein
MISFGSAGFQLTSMQGLEVRLVGARVADCTTQGAEEQAPARSGTRGDAALRP